MIKKKKRIKRAGVIQTTPVSDTNCNKLLNMFREMEQVTEFWQRNGNYKNY